MRSETLRWKTEVDAVELVAYPVAEGLDQHATPIGCLKMRRPTKDIKHSAHNVSVNWAGAGGKGKVRGQSLFLVGGRVGGVGPGGRAYLYFLVVY